MYESPQTRRLRSDLAAMERLAAESSIVRFRSFGKPANRYLIEFHGRSLAREKGKVTTRDQHEVEVKLGSSYPRTMPELRWLTPIYHPNISEIGLVCLGGYGTHWVPSLHLDALCGMLWDMARYHNYDIRSPYNRDAALWAANQTSILFPTDPRPLRDLRVAQGRIEQEPKPAPGNDPGRPIVRAEGEGLVLLDIEVGLRRPDPPPPPPPAPPRPPEEIVFLD
jgi:ubiquitin-protein ligase